MPRYPSVWRACKAIQVGEWRHGRPSVAQRRANYAASGPLGDIGGGLTVSEHDVPATGRSIRVRVHSPIGLGVRPAHVIMHSGSFCYGSPVHLDELASEYARTAGCTVLAVGYRLAPEHPYPAAVEDAYAAFRWTLENAGHLDVDPERVSIGGVSAGGCVAAAATLMLRDSGGPQPIFQLLEIPVLDVTASSPSVKRYGRGYLLTRAELHEAYASYVPDASSRRNPYASPLFARDLTGLPPAMIITAQYDPLRDEGEEYARRLAEAGVPVQRIRARGHVHSSTYTAMPSALRYRRLAAEALARSYVTAPRSR